jgi:cell division septum initiation protein DivIVA
MRDENWHFEWLGQLKKDVDHLTKMIYATQYEMEFFPLKEARKDLERVLQEGWNQEISPRMIIAWLKRLREKLESAGMRLELTAKIIGRNESKMLPAAKRTRRLIGRIDSTIGMIEKALNKMEDLPMKK